MPTNSTRNLKVVLDIETKLKESQGGLAEFQKQLSQFKLSDAIDKDFKKVFGELENELKNIQELSASKELSPFNEKQIKKSFDKIELLFGSLGQKLENADLGSGALQKNSKVIDALSDGIKKYRTNIESLKGAYDAAKQDLENYEKGYAELQEAAKKAQDELRRVQNETGSKEQLQNQSKQLRAQIQETTKLLDDANKKYEELSAKSADINNPEVIDSDELIKAQIEIANLTDKYNGLVEKQKELTFTTQKVNAVYEVSAKATKKAEQAQADHAKKLEELEKKVKETEDSYNSFVKNGLKELRKELKDSGIDFKEFGIDPSRLRTIEGFERALKKLEESSDETAKALATRLRASFETIKGASQNAASGFEQSAQALAELRDASKEIDRMTANLLRFFSIDNAVNLFKRAIRSAYETVKDLDAVMTETAVVTEFDVGDMWSQLPEYTQRANELGVSIHSAYEAATIYYQQGLKTNEVMAVSNATLKMARIAGLDAAEATDRMTNALRGFNMEITEANANNIADVYSKLAAISASDVDEISTAMTKTASLAASANMEFETTAAFLAQIIETTRESAETAGTALKTVIARFSEVKKLYSEGELLGTDEEGQEIDVNKVSTALRVAGINLNEFLTGSKGLDEVFLELASKWDDLTIVQQRYIATMAAGSRQQSRFIALMSDYARTQELVGAAQNATGASQEQYEKTLESLQTKLTKLKNAWDEFSMGIANSNIIKGAVDILTGIITAINKITSVGNDSTTTILKLVAAFTGFIAIKNELPKIATGIAKIFLDVNGEKYKTFEQNISKSKVDLKDLSNKFKDVNKAALGASAGLAVIGGILSEIGKSNGDEELQKFGNALSAIGGIATALISILGVLGVTFNPWVIFGGAIVAALFAGAKALGAFDSETEKATKKLEKFKKQVDESTESLKKADSLLSQLNDQTNTIDTLVKGTNEWKEAVSDLNQTYLDLIALYPELSNFIKVGADGLFEISDRESFDKTLQEIRESNLNDKATEAQLELDVSRKKVEDARKNIFRIQNITGIDEFAKALANNEFLINGDSVNLRKQIEDFFTSRGHSITDYTAANLTTILENQEGTYYEGLIALGEAVKTAEGSSKVYGQTLLAYTKQLSSFELEEGLDTYYNAFFDSAEQLKEVEGKSLDEIYAAAVQFANDIKNSPVRSKVYDTGASRSEINNIMGNNELTSDERAIAQNRLNAWNQLEDLVGEEYANNLSSETYKYLSSLNQKLSQGKIALPTNFLDVLVQIPKEAQAEFLNAFSGLDLTNISSIRDFPTLLNDLDISTVGAESAIESLIDELIELAETNKQINFDNVNSLLEELSGRKANERNWSQEQYEQWRNLGVTEGWVQTGEDQWTYTGQQSTMQQALQVSASTQGTGLSYNKYAGETDWRTLQDAQGGTEEAVARITGEAAAYEEAQDELEAYNNALKEGKGIQEALDKLQFATVIAEWNKKLKELKSALDDDLNGLENVEKGTDEYNDQLALMTTHLNNVLGLNLDAAFLKEGDNLNLLTEALDGNRASWEQLLINMDAADAKANLLSGRWGILKNQGADLENIVNALNGLTFEIDGTANMTEVIRSLQEAGWTADQVAAYLEHLGYAKVHFDVKTNNDGSFDLIGESTWKKLGLSDFSSNFGGGGGSGGGGGGGKEEVWENPYDELYNLVEKVNEALRQREKLERAYDRILKDRDATVDQIKQNSLDEIANLHKEVDLQRQLLDGRRQQLAMVGSETYKDSEGNFKTYEEMGVTRYASYNEQTGLLQIDWEGIDQIIDTEVGGAVEAYISRLEELQDEIESAHETMEDMGDQIREIKERNIKNYLEFEDRVYQAIVDREQKTIDEYSRLADQIEDSNSRTLDALRESIDLERQIRDNTKEEEDIADKEARLAYLSRDTSGANNLEILQLQKDIEEARENYQDKMIDQAIDQMSKDNDLAAQQREDQLNVMQAQLDWDKEHGAFWDETAALIQGSFTKNGMLNNGSPLVELLKSSDAFSGLSDAGRDQWINDLVSAWLQAQEGLSQAIIKNAERSGSLTLDNGTKLSYNKTTGRWTDKSGNEYENVTWDVQKQTFTGTNVGKPKTTTTVNGPTTKSGTGTNTGGSPGGIYTEDLGVDGKNPIGTERTGPGEDLMPSSTTGTTGSIYVTYKQVNAIQHRKITTQNGSTKSSILENHTFIKKNNQYICSRCHYVQQGNNNVGAGLAFATGGLADFSGPAWLDGSKSHPELVLNPKDTENFITLKNYLAKVSEGSGLGGDNYYDIDINVDEISSDYDVDKMADRIKDRIYSDSAYRNVNTINFIH